MSTIDWQLIIGYEWQDAQEYLNAEEVDFSVVMTKPPRKKASSTQGENQDLRVIAVQSGDEGKLVVVIASIDWTVM